MTEFGSYVWDRRSDIPRNANGPKRYFEIQMSDPAKRTELMTARHNNTGSWKFIFNMIPSLRLRIDLAGFHATNYIHDPRTRGLDPDMDYYDDKGSESYQALTAEQLQKLRDDFKSLAVEETQDDPDPSQKSGEPSQSQETYQSAALAVRCQRDGGACHCALCIDEFLQDSCRGAMQGCKCSICLMAIASLSPSST